MPELPEVETARAAIEAAALHRRIVDVDDTDSYECRPHRPGEIRRALVGRSLTAAHRRGKTMWCDTSAPGGSDGDSGPTVGIHLGMAGRLFITSGDGTVVEGGDPVRMSGAALRPQWDRFTIHFADGGTLRLFDKRRLGRVRLDPDLGQLGPDALGIGKAEFSAALRRGTAPVKARLLDQSAVAGIGNLLADETLWQARIWPGRPVGDLSAAEVTRLHTALRRSLTRAIGQGGVHTGRVIGFRHADAGCPRCHQPMLRGTIGGRTTWWCSAEQAA